MRLQEPSTTKQLALQRVLIDLNVTDITKQSPAETDAGTTAWRASSSPPDSAASHWAFINGWRVEPQSNDRPPVRSSVISAATSGTASPAARRSSTRRKHREMFKEWSQGRHD